MQAFRSDANTSRDASYNRHVSNCMDAISDGTTNKQGSSATITAEEEKQSTAIIQA
jgi:hypothetical protein